VEKTTWFVSGPEAESKLSNQFGEALSKQVARHADIKSLVVAAAEVAGFGYLLIGDSDRDAGVETWLSGLEIPVCDPDALHSLRVENVTPWNGLDVTVDNLPQEVDRDEKAISFDKGCYLGQETVARLDAIGRVNWLLRGFLAPSGHEPQAGDSVQVDGKPVARITSVGFDPNQDRWLAIGYAKRGFEKAGCEIDGWVVR
jgi:folate-binding protein YgfZ